MKTAMIPLIFPLLLSPGAQAQQVIDLYSGSVPNSKPSGIKEIQTSSPPGTISGVTKPTLEVYLPSKGKPTGAAVIICPGGAYKVVVYQAEGIRTAKEFAKHGVAAFVLKYRLPDDSTMIDKTLGPLQDAQQAVKTVREHASQWGIEKNKIGIMGFSAGGHLASTEATHYNTALIENDDHTSLRPDFLILVYPVISMRDSLTHPDTRTNLLGKNPSKDAVNQFSNELHVDANTPPAYITHAGDDKLVDVDNSIAFYEQLRRHNVAAELHLYPHGGHGFVLFQKTEEWMMPIFRWMRNSRWIEAQ
jgi:acetyl esterase/lipase